MLTFRHNTMNVSSINSFAHIKGGVHADCKDVYFVRAVGADVSFTDSIRQMDQMLSTGTDTSVYRRISGLSATIQSNDTGFYVQCCDRWNNSGRTVLQTKFVKDEAFSRMLSAAFCQALAKFHIGKAGVSASIEKNFAVKMMAWLDTIFGDALSRWNPLSSMKVVADNITKRQEYLFFYMITLLGCDVLLLQSRSDLTPAEDALALSAKFHLGSFVQTQVPEYLPAASGFQRSAGVQTSTARQNSPQPSRVNITHPSRPRQPAAVNSGTAFRNTGSSVIRNTQPQGNAVSGVVRAEKGFEELARLASSVVMIAVCDRTGKVLGTGSGIMIGRNGYILTNHHVASGGKFYSVRIEDDEEIYHTNEIIKYNSLLDLAVIRIPRQLSPIPIYNGPQKLVRGQRVVAIGSPMGLFNSVSDGIISGFRTIDEVDMIQFTAPTSHGSSGGAVLNMYGEVIGISTAGIDAGQNLNLAVSYESINQFIGGFL